MFTIKQRNGSIFLPPGTLFTDWKNWFSTRWSTTLSIESYSEAGADGGIGARMQLLLESRL